MATKTKTEYTPAERAAYNMGRGSTFSRTEQGRQKHVTKMFNGDKKLIASYKHGRQRGLADKKAYLEKVKQARKNK